MYTPSSFLIETYYSTDRDPGESHIARIHLDNWLRRLNFYWQVRPRHSECDLDGKVVFVISREADGRIAYYDEAFLAQMIRALRRLMTSFVNNVDCVSLDGICYTFLRLHEKCLAVDIEWDFGAFLSILRR